MFLHAYIVKKRDRNAYGVNRCGKGRNVLCDVIASHVHSEFKTIGIVNSEWLTMPSE